MVHTGNNWRRRRELAPVTPTAPIGAGDADDATPIGAGDADCANWRQLAPTAPLVIYFVFEKHKRHQKRQSAPINGAVWRQIAPTAINNRRQLAPNSANWRRRRRLAPPMKKINEYRRQLAPLICPSYLTLLP